MKNVQDSTGIVHYANDLEIEAMHYNVLRCRGDVGQRLPLRFVDTMVTCLECIVLGELS